MSFIFIMIFPNHLSCAFSKLVNLVAVRNICDEWSCELNYVSYYKKTSYDKKPVVIQSRCNQCLAMEPDGNVFDYF